MDLKLSDAFEKPAEGYEWTAHVVNINAGHNAAMNFMYLFGVDFEKIHREAMIEEAREEGHKKGLADGLRKGRKASARNMLNIGLGSFEQVAQVTGLSLEEVEKLAAAETEPVLA